MMARRIRAATLAVVVCAFAMPTGAIGQAATATISGIVVDQTDAIVRDATIQLVNLGTGLQRMATVGTLGTFTVTLLPPGEYRLNAQHDRFIWIATSTGIVHVHERGTDTFTQANGLSGNDVQALFEDREGNMWVATKNGLDRFRDVVVAAVSGPQALEPERIGAVRSAANGSMWLSASDRVAKWENGRLTVYRGRASRPVFDDARHVVVKGLPEAGIGPVFPDDEGCTWIATSTGFGYLNGDRFVVADRVRAIAVRSIAQDTQRNLWIADQRAGLLRLSPTGDLTQIQWAALGRKDFATALMADPKRGGLWLGFWEGGIARFEDGRIAETYSADRGLAGGRITNVRLASDGTLWVSAQGGLSRLHNGELATLTRTNGLPCDAVHWIIQDDSASLWLDTACGLVRVIREQVDAWGADRRHSIQATVFDGADGARMQATPSGYEPFVAKARDGKLWFVGPNGLKIVDPHRLNFNSLPAPVHVERIIADRTVIDAQSGGAGIRLPALTRDLQIDYTALSLTAPEKVRFRYKLDGHDRDWQDAGTRRQAFYNDLRPGTYRFRVTASNNSGVWNDAGTFIDFTVAPAYYQTTWFLTLSITTGVLLVWGVHRVRLGIVETHRREITALNERLMKAQEQERIRIAGELHDGVMQEMLAVTMMLGTAQRRIPEGSDAKATIDKIQQKMIGVGTEVRRVSHNLHPPALQQAGLPTALQAYCDEFAAGSGIPVTCDIDDRTRDLSRGTALALFRITQEALGNAAKHAAATKISVSLHRADGLVSLQVRDDGVGFDRADLGSSGGLGLITMRERAGQFNGTFEFDSAPGRGTTIRVVVPFR